MDDYTQGQLDLIDDIKKAVNVLLVVDGKSGIDLAADIIHLLNSLKPLKENSK
jgi:hypothetical protein